MYFAFLKKENPYIESIDPFYDEGQIVVITHDKKEFIVDLKKQRVDEVTGMEY